MPATPYDPYRSNIDEMKRANPSMFGTDEDAYAWGQRYYGWGSPSSSSSTTGGSASGGGGDVLPPSSPPPSTTPTIPGSTIPAVTTPAAPTITIPPPPAQASGAPEFMPPPGSSEWDPPAGAGPAAGDDVAATTAPRTITVNGQTFTIPSPPDLDTETTVGAAPSANAATLNYAPEDPMLGVVREQLLALMGRANATPSLNDPTLKPAADAYSAAQERARRGMVADTAESLSAKGIGSSGAADAAQRGSWETMGQNVGKFNAELITGEQAARRQDLTSALDMANELGMFKEQTALERDLATLDTETKTNLANLDAQLKNAGLSVQERLGIMDAELKKYGINLQGDMGLLNTVLQNEFNYAQLKVQGDIANLDASVKMALGQMDADLRKQGLSLQERLAILDNEVRKYGIDTQGNLGNLEIALRKELGIGQLKLGLLQTLLGNQFNYDNLGWDMAQWGADQNANIMNYWD